MLRIGSQVEYLPDACHALKPDSRGEYPWVMGKKMMKNTASRKSEEVVVEMTDAELGKFVAEMARTTNPAPLRNKLVFVRPKKAWPAVVDEVNDDGTVDLTVDAPNSAVTLDYDGVRVDPAGKTPHSCRRAPGSED